MVSDAEQETEVMCPTRSRKEPVRCKLSTWQYQVNALASDVQVNEHSLS